MSPYAVPFSLLLSSCASCAGVAAAAAADAAVTAAAAAGEIIMMALTGEDRACTPVCLIKT